MLILQKLPPFNTGASKWQRKVLKQTEDTLTIKQPTVEKAKSERKEKGICEQCKKTEAKLRRKNKKCDKMKEEIMKYQAMLEKGNLREPNETVEGVIIESANVENDEKERTVDEEEGSGENTEISQRREEENIKTQNTH